MMDKDEAMRIIWWQIADLEEEELGREGYEAWQKIKQAWLIIEREVDDG